MKVVHFNLTILIVLDVKLYVVSHSILEHRFFIFEIHERLIEIILVRGVKETHGRVVEHVLHRVVML